MMNDENKKKIFISYHDAVKIHKHEIKGDRLKYLMQSLREHSMHKECKSFYQSELAFNDTLKSSEDNILNEKLWADKRYALSNFRLRRMITPHRFWASKLLYIVNSIRNIYQLRRIKKPPGNFLNCAAEFLFSKKNYKHIFQPLISDMREEYYEALAEGRTLKAKWINASYWCTFFITIVLHGFSSVLKVIEKIKKLAD